VEAPSTNNARPRCELPRCEKTDEPRAGDEAEANVKEPRARCESPRCEETDEPRAGGEAEANVKRHGSNGEASWPSCEWPSCEAVAEKPCGARGGEGGGWALHDIAITNTIWCTAYKRGVGKRAYIAQWSCNSIAIGLALQVGRGIKG